MDKPAMSARSQPAWTIRALGRSTAIGRTAAAWFDAESMSGRVTYTTCTDEQALAAFDAMARREGILPALESSHAVAKAMELASQRGPQERVVVCLSGRGDKDAGEIARLKGEPV